MYGIPKCVFVIDKKCTRKRPGALLLIANRFLHRYFYHVFTSRVGDNGAINLLVNALATARLKSPGWATKSQLLRPLHDKANEVRGIMGSVLLIIQASFWWGGWDCWSSSEVIVDAGSGAWVFNFNNSNFARNSLTYPGYIRAVFAY